ncbi:MAG: biopolymer transporter ExbD [Candidatus Eisenbacteria bacterium]
MSLRKKRKRAASEPEELNLLPLMSLFVALVPALLYSAVFVPVSALGLDFPGTGGAAGASPLALAVRLADSTYTVEGVPDSAYAPIPRLTGEADPLRELRAELDDVHARYPTSGGAILVVSPQVPYRDVVQVMDQVREAGFGNSTLLGAQP